MPLYEYFCEPCNGVFELLRPAKDASKPQPCPQCDEDAKRTVSKQWSAFIFREGFARRLPDDGGYWHLGHKVSQPLTGAVYGMEHPEVRVSRPGYDAPSVEEIEQYEFRQTIQAELKRDTGTKIMNQSVDAQDSFFKARLQHTSGTPKEQAARKRAVEGVKRAKNSTKKRAD